MAILFDLDGVLRDLVATVPGWVPQTYHEPCPDGSDFCGWIDRHLEALEEAPETEYVALARSYSPVMIMTCQPVTWRPFTSFWVYDHLPGACIRYVDHIEDKLAMLRPGDRLIEDYPYFSSYRQIILVDRAYNRHVEATRVYDAVGLGRVIAAVGRRGC